MIIDFHTHVFPDNLAQRALSALLADCGHVCTPISDGTVSGLLRNMREFGVDVSVIQPVITKPSQVKTTNEWVKSVCEDGRLVGFGGIYPHSGSYRRDIDFVADLGLKGLKFHAEYQDFVIDDPKMLKIYDYALSKGLSLLHHAGFNPGFPMPCKSSPQRFANIGKAMQGGVIIAAHLGGHAQWDDVEKYLAGTDIYLDTSMGLEYYSPEQFSRIVQKHGADKILFGSDAPWSHAQREIEHLRALPFAEKDIAAILGGNAARILNIQKIYPMHLPIF